MNCGEAARFFNTYIDRELSPEEVHRLEEHMQKCRGCTGHLEYDKALRRVLRNRSFCRQLSPELKELLRTKLQNLH